MYLGILLEENIQIRRQTGAQIIVKLKPAIDLNIVVTDDDSEDLYSDTLQCVLTHYFNCDLLSVNLF